MRAFSCPHCAGTALEGNHCAYCGTRVLFDESQEGFNAYEEYDSFEIPVGEYKGCNSNIILEQSGFTIRNFEFDESGEKNRVTIPYNQVCGLYYYRPKEKFVSWGYIVIRWTGNEHMPLPDEKGRQIAKQNKEESIVCFSRVNELVFMPIFWFLRSKAPHWVKWSIEDPNEMTEGANSLYRSIRFEPYFQQFNPIRDKAIELLQKEGKMPKKLAKRLVYKAFDELQDKLYEKNPQLAVRDLNRIVRTQAKWNTAGVVDV